uniref:uncharacterized protein LOC122589972 isoform X2 n=1 Tax=Erigeron canadensis TaxID=72917 RepID=UPI001CB9A2DA|nr:uncharacterized protein LOC122589972 isoform X2 [Erigeron canadensis]
MGVHEIVLLIMVLFSFCSSALFAQVNKNSTPVGNDCGMVNQNKYTSDVTSGRGGGRPVGSGGNGNGDQTNSSPQGGGNGVVPVYAAGAAGQRRNHKGAAATDTLYRKGRLAVLIATVTASFLLS